MADNLAIGQAAGTLRQALAPRVLEREQTIIRQLVQHHYDGTLTEPVMRAGIAGLAELRKLMGDLDRDIRRGHDASARDVQSVKAPGRDTRTARGA
jgi:hypothetical protein